MKFDNLLKKVANLAEFTAVKANGMTSWFDSYQPEEPKMVREMAEEKNLKDAEKAEIESCSSLTVRCMRVKQRDNLEQRCEF